MLLPAMIQASTPTAMPATRPLTQILLIAFTLALPISFVLIWLYRRAVKKAMRRASSSIEIEPEILSYSPNEPRPLPPQLAVTYAPPPVPPESEAAALLSDLFYAPWRAAKSYLLAGGCFALILASGTSSEGQEEIPFLTLIVFWWYFWPMVLVVNLTAAVTWLAKLSSVLIYFLILVAIGVIGSIWDLDWLGITIVFGIVGNLPITLLLLTFLNRRVRAVGPLVLVFTIMEALGLKVATAVALSYGPSELTDANLVGLLLLGMLIPIPLGLLLLRRLRRKYERNEISDQSILIDAIMLIFAASYSLILTANGPLGIFFVLFALFIFKRVARAGWQGRAAMRPTARPRRLLLLRVFSGRRRGVKLLAKLATHWRHIGSIDLMVGPDLATNTVEPHEFLDFLTGKLAHRFIDGPEALQRRCAEINRWPDRDGRFRVNEFFCYANTWQMVLRTLVKDADVVMMDLRGFNFGNAGSIHEIRELINTVPLDRVVFVIETNTDEELVLNVIRHSWDRMEPTSPNRLSPCGQLRLFRFSGSRGLGLHQLLRALCLAAHPA